LTFLQYVVLLSQHATKGGDELNEMRNDEESCEEGEAEEEEIDVPE
jgi:hypothetical protein